MFANYFYLRRAAAELNFNLQEAIVTEIFSQQKNILFLRLPSDIHPDRHLILSLNPNSPYLQLRNHFNKAKKNFINFFSDQLPLNILSVKIAVNDRIIKFSTENGFFLFAIQGARSNFYFYSDDLNEFKVKKNEYSIKDSLREISFIDGLKTELETSPKLLQNYESLLTQYPMIKGILKKEVIYRKNNISSDNIGETFNLIIEEILGNKIKVGYNSDLGKVIFIPDSFLSVDAQEDSKYFENYNSAINYYISLHSRKKDLSQISNELSKYFDKELSQIAQRINKLRHRVESGSKEEEYYNLGNLLLSNIHLIKKGMKEILVTDYITNQEKKITIDPKLFPKDNVNRYFEKAKDEKINYNKSRELLKFNLSKYDLLKEEFDKFNSSNSFEEIKSIHKKLIKVKENSIKMETGSKFKYWHYRIEAKYDVFVGRDSKSNDYLSIKFAKQNDYWFHARGLPGSHVVLRVENTKEGIPKSIIKKAASLAAYYSKAKTAGSAPVSYTFAKFVYKKKGMLPGKVMLTKENTLLVKPEIPKQVEIIEQ